MPRKVKGKSKIEEDNCDDKYNEKEKLLKALKDHGPSVIHDLDLLKSYFPSNSIAEIKFLISSYEKKGKELSQKENSIDSFPEMKNIAQWSSIISNCVPFPAKKDDLSQILKDVFGEMEKLFPPRSTSMVNINDDESNSDSVDNAEDRVDYRAVHSYFSSILENRFPVKLENREAAIVLSIMDNLTEMVESLNNSEEKDFLTSEAWWKPAPSLTNEETSNSQNVESVTINQSSTSQNVNQNVNQNGQDTNNIEANNPNRPEYYEDLPRIRKIRECFNPLKIPKIILDQNHDLMTAFLI